MKISHYIDENLLLVELNEEIDHHSSNEIRRKLDYEIERFLPSKVILDFKEVKFMDSAGIGLIIGRYKKIKIHGGQVFLMNVGEKIKTIFEMSGILKIMSIVDNINQNYLEKI